VSRIVAVAVFAIFMVSFVVGAHFYLANRLVRDPSLPEALEAIGLFVFVIGALSVFAVPVAERTLARPWRSWIAWPGSIWMGFAFLMLLGVLATDGLLVLLGSAGGSEASLGVARWRAAGVAGLCFVASGLALRRALQGPELKRLELCLPAWPRELDGFRIVQLSDIHIGPLLDRRFARELVERSNALEADLIAVTGDLVDGPVSKLVDEVAPFAELRARQGVFFVTGNHDHYSDAEGWSAHVASLGMRVLRNEHVQLELAEGARFVLAGVDDHNSRHLPGEGGEDLERALEGVPVDLPVVLLAHDPATFKKASERRVVLQLSGHTHGGQIWPFRWFVRMATPFVAGLYERSGSILYVSCGTGFWGPPMRLGAPAEITEITLRHAEGPRGEGESA